MPQPAPPVLPTAPTTRFPQMELGHSSPFQPDDGEQSSTHTSPPPPPFADCSLPRASASHTASLRSAADHSERLLRSVARSQTIYHQTPRPDRVLNPSTIHPPRPHRACRKIPTDPAESASGGLSNFRFSVDYPKIKARSRANVASFACDTQTNLRKSRNRPDNRACSSGFSSSRSARPIKPSVSSGHASTTGNWFFFPWDLKPVYLTTPATSATKPTDVLHYQYRAIVRRKGQNLTHYTGRLSRPLTGQMLCLPRRIRTR